MKTAEFGQPCAAVPQPGRCRVCGCGALTCTVPSTFTVKVRGREPPHDLVDKQLDGHRACRWADETRTLCDAPACIRAAKRELGLVA